MTTPKVLLKGVANVYSMYSEVMYRVYMYNIVRVGVSVCVLYCCLYTGQNTL